MRKESIDNSLENIDTSGLQIRQNFQITDKSTNLKYQQKLQKNRILHLYMNGMSVYEIHKETGFDLTTCKTITKQIKADIKEMDKHTFIGELKSILLGMTSNHAMIGGDLIKKYMVAVDTNSRDEVIAYGREIRANDKDLMYILRSMGVSEVTGVVDNNTSPEKSTKNEIVDIEYQVSDAEDLNEINEEARRAAERLLAYTRVSDDMAKTEVKMTVRGMPDIDDSDI